MQTDAVAAAHFDAQAGVWVFSRYSDVLAALQEPRLWPPGQPESRAENGKLRARPEVQDAFSAAKLAQWQPRLQDSAETAVARLPSGRTFDLVSELAVPWCLEVALLVTGTDGALREQLADLSRQAFAGTGAPDGSPLETQAAAATASMQRILRDAKVPMAEPTFVGVSQTLARLLAGEWLALIEHPAQWSKLRSEPDLMPRAVEEMLRYGGIVRSIVRRATADLELAGVRVAAGERVLLLLAAANRDQDQFPNSEQFDVSRRPSGQVALGAGRNSCVGAPVIRMTAGLITGALVARFATAKLAGTVPWSSGSRFCWPTALPVTMTVPI